MKIEIDLNNPPAAEALIRVADLLLAAAEMADPHAFKKWMGTSDTETSATETSAPAPVPPATANSAAAPAPGSAGAELELDARGIPWDSRIHSRNQSKNKDGTWRNARGADPERVKKVEAELKALQANGSVEERVDISEPDPHSIFAESSTPPKPPAPPESSANPPNPPPAGPAATSAPTGGASSAPAAPSGQLTFASVMRKAAAEKKTKADLDAAFTAVGVKNAPGLAAKPDLLPQFHQALFGA